MAFNHVCLKTKFNHPRNNMAQQSDPFCLFFFLFSSRIMVAMISHFRPIQCTGRLHFSNYACIYNILAPSKIRQVAAKMKRICNNNVFIAHCHKTTCLVDCHPELMVYTRVIPKISKDRLLLTIKLVVIRSFFVH